MQTPPMLLATVGGTLPTGPFAGAFLIAFVLVFLNNLIYLRSFRKFAKYLQSTHPEAAQSFNATIGQAVTTGSPSRNFTAIFKYFWAKQYQSLNDATLTSYGSTTRRLLITSTVLFSILFLTILLTIIFH
jgi:hypothetical protein